MDRNVDRGADALAHRKPRIARPSSPTVFSNVARANKFSGSVRPSTMQRGRTSYAYVSTRAQVDDRLEVGGELFDRDAPSRRWACSSVLEMVLDVSMPNAHH